MNSYNDNLHDSVVNSLSAQELALKNAKAKLDASMFSLYYAQGAYITAYENLEVDTVKYNYKQHVNKSVIVNSDISTNVLASANQGSAYVASSVSNTATAAANTQIATNAIVKLASDMGSIFSIINAADFDTEIYEQAYNAYALMNDTAYVAEKTSQQSMEASAQIAEVSAKTVADMAVSTDASVKNLLGVLNADFDAISTKLIADNAALAAASVAEKIAEGKLEDLGVIYKSTKNAYGLSNAELNLDLTIATKDAEGVHYPSSFIVSFNKYTNPFSSVESTNSILDNPVQDYYIMYAKESKKSVFSISDAEGIISKNDTTQFHKIDASSLSSDKTISTKIFFKADDGKTIQKDTDGEVLAKGKGYVTFVVAIFKMDYKKTINNFNDYITAPSSVFTVTNQLIAPAANTIEVTFEDSKTTSIIIDNGTNKEIPVTTYQNQEIVFSASQTLDITKASYRCMFLPDNSEFIKGLLKSSSLERVEQNVTNLDVQKIVKKSSKVENLQSQINDIQTNLKSAEDTSSIVIDFINAFEEAIHGKSKKVLTSFMSLLKKENNGLETLLSDLKIEKPENVNEVELVIFARLVVELEIVLISIEITEPTKKTINLEKPGFFFNLTVAEQVTASNYSVAISELSKGENAFKVLLADESTDNFGNRLIPGNKYIPVILTISNDTPQKAVKFDNALSDYSNTQPFYYKFEKVQP